jgi:uncharacterized protein (DUF1800 family)
MWHEPGSKTVLGKTYPAGPERLRLVLHDLACIRPPRTSSRPSWRATSRPMRPPPALVDRLAGTYLKNGTQLAPVYRELIRSPEAWTRNRPS